MASKIELVAVEEDDHTDRPKVDVSKPAKYDPIDREDISVTLPLTAIESDTKPEATLTLVVSDLHIGDSDFLPDTFMSCVDKTKRLVKYLNDQFDIKNFLLVLNGDIVSGRDVYRYQRLRTLVQRGHWQVELATQITRELVNAISNARPIDKTFVLKGNHESLGENYMIYLTNYLPNTWYAGHYKVLNIAHPIGNYNVLFTHGFGRSEYYPVGYGVVRDCWKAFNQYRTKGIQIEEICVAHTHWLQPRLYLEGLTFNVTGGFQRWEKTISQRPSGFLLMIHTQGETSVTGVRSDPVTEAREQSASDLEFINLEFYSKKLRDALAHLRAKKQPDEVVM